MGQKQQFCELCYQPRMGLVAKSGQMLDIYIYTVYKYIYIWIVMDQFILSCVDGLVTGEASYFGIFWVPTDWNSWLQKLLMRAIYSEFTC
jgi:hypothetical protein